MTRQNDTFFDATRKGQFILASLLLLQVILLAFILTRLDGGPSHGTIRNAVEPCLYPYNAQPERLERDGNCLPHPTRVSGRA